MYDQVYQTKAAGFYNNLLTNILSEIERARIDNPSTFNSDRIKGTDISDEYSWLFNIVNNDHTDVPQFAHPIAILNKEMAQNIQLTNVARNEVSVRKIIIDARPYLTGHHADQHIKARSDFNISQILRGHLIHQWMTLERVEFLAAGDLPIRTYVYWLSGIITRALSLEPQTLYDLNKVISLRYLSYFYQFQGLTIDDRIKQTMIRRAAQAMRFTDEDLYTILDRVGDTLFEDTSINGFIECMVKGAQSDRIKEQLNVPKLIQLVGGSWMGTNAREVAAVAIEHVPTFYAMLYSAAGDRGLRKTHFGKTLELMNKPQEINQYVRAVQLLLK